MTVADSHVDLVIQGLGDVLDGLGFYTAHRIFELGAADAALFIDGGDNSEDDLIDWFRDALRVAEDGPVVLVLNPYNAGAPSL